MESRRYPHYLRQTTGGKWPGLVVCLDAEKDMSKRLDFRGWTPHKLERWHAVILKRYGMNYYELTTVNGVDKQYWWDGLALSCQRSGEVWVICHHAADCWAMLGGWDIYERIKPPLPVIEDPPTIIRFRLPGSRAWVTWVDTLNYGAEPAKGTLAGRQTADWIADWFTLYSQICREYKLGSLKATVGSQAIHGFKTSYYSGGIYNHVNETASRIETDGYFGGRCECHHIGNTPGTLYHLDYRSLYPYCSSKFAVPARLRAVLPGNDLQKGIADNPSEGWIARVDIETDEPAYPKRRQGQMIFPIGRFETTLCGQELHDAIFLNRVSKIHAAAVYDCSPALRGYADAIYGLRVSYEDCNVSGIPSTAKLLCVSLVGKFGQHRWEWIETNLFHDYSYYGQWEEMHNDGRVHRMRSLAGIVYRDYDIGIAPDSNIAIAGWITSAGRMELLRAIRIAGWETLYYCDTDSVMVDETGYERLRNAGLVADREWGRLQIKCVSKDTEIRGAKYYTEKGRVVCSGMPSSRIDDVGDGKHYWYRSTPVHSLLSLRRPAASAQLRQWTRETDYRGRIVREDGRTEPIRLQEW